MRRLVWAILFILILGVASAAVLVSVNVPGIIRVLNPKLVVTPSSLDFGTVTVDATSGATGVASLTIENTGNTPLIITYSCNCQGFTLVLPPLPGPLAVGATWTGQAELTVPAGTLGGDYNIQLTITGST